jgi:hypothetical protein
MQLVEFFGSDYGEWDAVGHRNRGDDRELIRFDDFASDVSYGINAAALSSGIIDFRLPRNFLAAQSEGMASASRASGHGTSCSLWRIESEHWYHGLNRHTGGNIHCDRYRNLRLTQSQCALDRHSAIDGGINGGICSVG